MSCWDLGHLVGTEDTIFRVRGPGFVSVVPAPCPRSRLRVRGPGSVSAVPAPTPLEPLPRLAQALGLDAGDLWIKHDDLTGLGGGGNKLCKLEWTCGVALAAGATTLITTGAPQSNHARLTAAAGARPGLDVVLVLAGEPGASASGNLALDGLLGARMIWAGDDDPATRAERLPTNCALQEQTPR